MVDKSKRLLIILKREQLAQYIVFELSLLYSIGKEERHRLPNEPQIA